MDEPRLDRICQALSDDTRRWLWAELGRRPGATTTELAAARRSLTRWAIMKHLGVLRDAGLIQTLPEGRRRRHYREPASLEPLARWLEGARRTD
jgi:DNA-binding transcriptional ArsR family regulator